MLNTKIEHWRRVEAFYARLAERGPLPQSALDRWVQARAFLVEHDTTYIWAE